ncbi:MAG: fatty acid desaturase [Microcoleus sp. PH2017_10_PVI_O_A]|uniref:fatty acid desaturase family protein n=1 Tax=unclassified Microcoleus TaxID=2642155 RepID=UPI001D69D2DB|nr:MULTISPECIES: fatty acid desaturase [unclassified Microcoleus]TAE77491.1 MAG: fatty acid desaturase [Oscillatoriales cyanobacterium]MCC3406042.1 fatty acid desaturase [Microcoleus sp. PH2017_10_PVI_O_A]MCC3460211.1 fatty acid desaturase [Microcoleus sp. PH2017_11_PCY_U_A]MCC3478633.1 fatty acid desaturase [Microcoleus sp. PH2017_12_PCY_D_A]MCC3559517.1 fatty acid desaturase [Microcoleus sp. PH2017_27_LUM_O_A]
MEKMCGAAEISQKVENFGIELKSISKVDHVYSFAKLLNYFALVVFLSVGIIFLQDWKLSIILQLLLGLTFAHGLELQHECLHHNFFKSKILNRFFGFLFGVPMLVSYTHYRVQHLHHHKYLGTEKNAEIFDYDESSLESFNKLVVRAWNFARVPTFFSTLFNFMKGKYPEVFSTDKAKKDVLIEYLVLVTIFITLLSISVFDLSLIPLKIWFIPWLVFGELFHFLIELPEHLYCKKTTTDVFLNTRSIETNPIISYITNGNNYHVEHHLYPSVAVHNLEKVHHTIRPKIEYLSLSYFDFFRETFQKARSNRS